MRKFFSKLFKSNRFALKSYSVNFSIDRLVPGVDNTRYDVYLSPDLIKIINRIALQLVIKHAKASESPLEEKSGLNLIREIDEFKRLCSDVLESAINKSKLDREIQVNFLFHAAITKILLKTIRDKYELLLEHYKNSIRKLEIAASRSISDIIKLKEELSGIQQNRQSVLRDVAAELFQYLIDAQDLGFKENCLANFGAGATLPDGFFSNPILHTGNDTDDFFMIENYVLIGHRLEDAIRYDVLNTLVSDFFTEINQECDEEHILAENVKTELENGDSESEPGSEKTNIRKIDALIHQVDNINVLINCFQTQEEFRRLKKEKAQKEEIVDKKQQYKAQKRLLEYFYKKFKHSGLIKGITVFFEMQPLYMDYCPPLFPHDVLQFIVKPKERRSIVSKLRRLKGGQDKSVSLKPLKKKIGSLNRVNTQKKKEYLILFLQGFARYQRDLRNYNLLKEAMDWVNPTTDEKTLNLSRANHTLYEFLLPHEKATEEKPVINHVIIKTDVRGSTDITHQIKERGLNPAYYFSLNFFDPITAILTEYGADKVFLEGDAIILSIFEQEETPMGWYSVARACGLAIKMLLITQRYNVKNKKAQLPKLEQGIGISYQSSPPAFLFDGTNRIMISPAINLADRLSGCTKSVRKIMRSRKKPFNLYVFKSSAQEDYSTTVDDLFLRYNVNGIELNEAGFKKLCEEIDLKTIECKIPEIQKDRIKLHTGRFPTMTGKYQRLVIRESEILEVNPADLSVIRVTDQKYYEVCTNTKLYEYAKKVG